MPFFYAKKKASMKHDERRKEKKDYYDTSSSNEKKICPLTGEPPSGRFIECYLSDCKRVGPSTCGTLYGKCYLLS